jgi:CRISPR/Cas system CSM-associated protein Csm3 (group 7 of RAMP superfamily)
MGNKHTHRYIARFIIEADTPLFVGSGQASLLKDALVQKDSNGLPMIPGTSLAGVLRHAFEKEDWCSSIFGASGAEKDGMSSMLKVSAAIMMLNEAKVSEGILEDIDPRVHNKYDNLPSRQHVRITDKGTAKKNGLFDNEIVYKGTRFVFEIELRGTAEDQSKWDALVQQVQSPTFRIGSGTRNGYGSLKVIALYNKTYDLEVEVDFKDYLNFSPSFNSDLKFEKAVVENKNERTDYLHYKLNLEPDSFFVFSEGFGDDEADNRPLEEEVAVYKNKTVEFEAQTVIPASSIKGAIAHRVAFHYNKLSGDFADEDNGELGSKNEAVFELFGSEGGSKENTAKAGNVFINDFYYSKDEIANNKIFNHVAIDRFTGGGMDGALFSEKVSNLLSNEFNFEIYVKNNGQLSEEVLSSLENTLKDIAKGLLPLGGMTTKGNGMFTGSVLKNDSEIFNYNTKFEN